MTHGIAVFDSERRLVLCNDLFLDLHGYSREFASPGRAYQEIVRENARRGEYGPSDIDEHVVRQLKTIDDLQSGGASTVKVERKRPDGTVLELAYTRLPNGGFVKTYTDISERVRAEKERSRLQDQFHAAERMQALGTLAGGIAHDFNNILGIMMGNCKMALSDLKGDDPVRSYLEPILTAGERARSLVPQVLSYSRRADVQRQPVDATKVAGECIAVVRAMVSKEIAVEQGAWTPSIISANATQLHQVILNLCVNAAHAIGDGPGRISVAVEDVDITEGMIKPLMEGEAGGSDRYGKLAFGQLKAGPHCRISVYDTRDGIPEEVLPRIFEPFFTTKEVGKGTGLGLAAAQGIIRDHQGAITVETAVGVGTLFSVYFTKANAMVQEVRTDAPIAAVGSQERIMLVDDDRLLITVTAKILQRHGYRVDVFVNPLEAIAAFEQAPSGWDLVVTDRNMPGMSGEDVVARVLGRRPDLPTVMLTGFVNPEDEERIRALGVRRVVIKPVVGKELAAVVRTVIEGHGERHRAINTNRR